MRIKPGKIFLCLLFSIALLLACNNNSLVEEKFTVEGGKWHMDETFRSTFEVQDTVSQYNFFLNVRNAGNYPYSNLFIFVKTEFPNGKSSIDTVECILADKSGKWSGKGLGDVLDNRILYRYNRQFPMSGQYSISLQHAMRDTVIPAILNVGLSIEKEV